MLASALMTGPSVFVWGADGLGDGDLRRSRRRSGGGDQGLQVRVGEELLEVLDALPFVHHEHEAVADREPVVDAAARPLGLRSHLRELLAVIGQRLAERGYVTLELQGNDDAHDWIPSLGLRSGPRPAASTGTSPRRGTDHPAGPGSQARAAASPARAW